MKQTVYATVSHLCLLDDHVIPKLKKIEQKVNLISPFDTDTKNLRAFSSDRCLVLNLNNRKGVSNF